MSSMKTKKKKSTATTLVKNMKTTVTLSDRLKIAGIREMKPQCGGKQIRNLNKKSKKRSSKKMEAEKHRQIRSKDLNNNQNFKSKKILSEISSKSSLNSNIYKKSAEETLNVSLDFIKDWQKYKKRFRNPKNNIRLSNQEMGATSIDSGQHYLKKEESRASPLRNSISRTLEEKQLEKHSGNECSSLTVKLNTKNNIHEELKCFIEKVTKTYYAEPVIYKQSVSDVAKIDKKYLESVLSLASQSNPSKKKVMENDEIEKGRTKHLTVKNYSDFEAKNKDLGVSSTFDENSQSIGKQLKKNPVSVRLLRDLTKSEVQLHGIKKFIGGQRNSEELKTEKELAQSKSELKKRKPRNKILKTTNKEFIEIPFSSEVSQAKDVKEIWRRETKKKSENSLTSNSSSTIPENDDNPKWKNFGLQSYRILYKLVEEEINKISKKSEIKNNTTEIKNKENDNQKQREGNVEQGKANLKSKNINSLKLPKNENPVSEKEKLYAKKKFLLTENLHAYEGEKNKTPLLSILNEDSIKTPTGELKVPEAKKTKDNRFPKQSIDNWSILNRLEQAFLALGNSNFKNDFTSKTKQDPKSNSTSNCEISKKNSKEIEEQEKMKTKTPTPNDALMRKDPEGHKPKSRSNNNEWIFPRRKNDDAKLPSYTPYIQLKEKFKKNESQSSNSFDQGGVKEFLPRKKTDNVNLLKNFSAQPKISITSIKTISSFKSDKTKLRAKPMTKNWKKDVVKMKSLSCNQGTEKKEDSTKAAVSKNSVKPPPENIHGTPKTGIPRPRMSQKMKSERTEPVEDRLKSEISEKKETNQRNIKERTVKERSILSVHRKQKESGPSTGKFSTIQESSSNLTAALKSNTGDLLMKRAQRNLTDLFRKSTIQIKDNKSNNSFIRISFSEKSNSSLEDINKPSSNNNSSKQNMSPDSQGRITPVCSINQIKIFQSNPLRGENSRGLAQSNPLFLWEKDIRRYREIVNDIMSQYKRIEGFLKYSERLGISSSSKIDSDVSSQKSISNEKPSKLFNKPQDISLQEYRKKIITEYQALPFFEYKQLERDDNVDLHEPRKRNLSVVSDINKEKDFDVKDYQPKITKVLGSQLYVDKENLFKKNFENKSKHKKLSLQEILLCRDKSAFQQHCLKTYSMPKTIMLSNGEVCYVPSNEQRQKP